jgi:hypothetical protein
MQQKFKWLLLTLAENASHVSSRTKLAVARMMNAAFAMRSIPRISSSSSGSATVLCVWLKFMETSRGVLKLINNFLNKEDVVAEFFSFYLRRN